MFWEVGEQEGGKELPSALDIQQAAHYGVSNGEG